MKNLVGESGILQLIALISKVLLDDDNGIHRGFFNFCDQIFSLRCLRWSSIVNNA